MLHVDSPQPLRFDQPPGTFVPVHASAIGKALLAFAPDPAAEVAELAELATFTAATLTSRDALLADLERTRRRGWALNDGERFAGVRTMAAPVLDGSGQAWAGAGDPGPRGPPRRRPSGTARRRARRHRRDDALTVA